MKNYASDYTLPELLVVAAAREFHDSEVCVAGIGIPLISAYLAKCNHAPTLTILTEWGAVNPNPRRLPYCVSCCASNERTTYVSTMGNNLSDIQRGYVDLGVISGAQVDKYGNVNSTLIGGDGSVEKCKIMMAGPGGAPDIASSARRTLIMMRTVRRTFVEKVDHLTSAGYLDGPGSREAHGLIGGGPVGIITAEGVFGFDDETKEVYLATYHPGCSVEAIKKEVPWDLRVADDVHETEIPTVEEVNFIRTFDPYRVYLGNGREILGSDFDKFLKAMDDSFDRIDALTRKK